MSDDAQTIAAIVGLAALGLIGALCVVSAAVVRGGYGAAPSRGKRWFLKIFGGFLVLLGLSGAIVLGAGIVYAAIDGDAEIEAVMFATVALMLFAVLAVIGVLLFRVSKELVAGPVGIGGSSQVERKIEIVAGAGWTAVVLALIASQLGVLGGIFVMTIVAVVIAHQRMAHYSRLLWTLAVAVERGLPLDAEIEGLAASVGGRHRSKLHRLAGRLHSGEALPDALAQGRGLLPQQTLTALHAAAETGTLAMTLREHAVEQDAQIESFSGFSSIAWVLMYYAVVIAMVVLTSRFFYIWIVPRLREIFFVGFDLEPAPNWLGQLTRLDSSFPAVLLMFLIAVLAAGCLILLGSCLTANWRNLRAPWLTKWFLRRETPWILRSIADTVDSGRPLPLGLAPLAVTYFRPHVRDKLSQVENEVVDGRDCWNALKDVGFIRASEAALLKAGSAVGNLSWTLRTLADRIQQRQRHRLKCVIESVWPFCVLFVGVFVLWFCLSVFVPFLRLVTALTAEPRL